MPDQLQLRGGTTTEHATFTGASKEVTIDTTKKTAVVHDASTAGGNPLMREDGANSALVNGSVTEPALAFAAGDADNGIYSPGTDQVAITTNGVERVEWGASEVVFNDGGNDYDFRVEGDTNANLLVVDASTDRVGVGVASPGRYLDVQYSDSTAYSGTSQLTDTVRIFNTNSTTGSYSALELAATNANGAVNQWTLANISSGTNFQGDLAFHRRTSTAGWSEALRIDSSGKLLVGMSNAILASDSSVFQIGSTVGAYVIVGRDDTALINGSTIGGMRFYGNDSDGNYDECARIQVQADGTHGDDSKPTRMMFLTTADGASGVTERMRIDSSGAVGIGTTGLTVQNNDGNYRGLQLGLGAFAFGRTDDTPLHLTSNLHRASSGWAYTGNTTASLISLGTNIVFSNAPSGTAGNSVTPNERMRIDSSGRLLVGTSSTSAVLRAIFEATSGGSGGGTVMISRGTSTPTLNQTLGEIQFADSNHGAAAVVIAKRDTGTWTSGSSQPSRLEFSTTADGASSPTERMRIDSAGNVMFRTTSNNPFNNNSAFFNVAGYLGVNHINATASGTGYVAFNYNGGEIGSITQSGTNAVAYNTSSDYRLKENVVSVTDGITRLQQLKPSRFNFIADPDKTVDGFIAHEVQSVVPEAITGEKDAVDDEGNPKYQGIDQSKLVPLLTAALQEAITKIETLEAKVAALEAN